MLLCFFSLLHLANSEWVGNITLYPQEKVYKGISCLSSICNRNIDEFYLKYQVCSSSNCTNQTIIYETREVFFRRVKDHNPILAIVITNNHSIINTSIPVFALPEKNAKDILSLKADYISIEYRYDYHCSERAPELIMKICFLVIWVGITVLWIYNNHTLNSNDAELFHKFSTVILIFKTMNLLAMFSIAISCPITSRMTGEFLELFEKQTRSLYETSFFAYLLLLSKGWVLAVNTMDKKEFNYLIIVIIFIYILDSAVNIIGIGLIYLVYLLYAVVVLHVTIFSIASFRLLKTQLELIQETGMDLLLPVARSKQRQFYLFLGVAYCYFLCEFFVHLGFSGIELLEFGKQAIAYFCHEIIEVGSIGLIFYLYRARKLGRFFSVELQGSPGFQRVIPFYEAKSECPDGIMLAITMPRGDLKLGRLA